MKTIKWDIVFIIGLAIILLVLSQTDNMHILTELPFITIYVAYIIGRLAGELSKQNKDKSE